MSLRSQLRRHLKPVLHGHSRLWNTLVRTDTTVERVRHSAARALPVLIRPEPRHLEVAITAYCNLRCVGCRYGRDFMPGSQLPFPIVRDLLEDAAAAGFWDVRFYGGEPLLHPDLPAMVRTACDLGISPYVTTNGIRLREKIDELFDAGLRTINIGFYGLGERYDAYVQRPGRHKQLESRLEYLRQQYGAQVRLRLNWLLMRPSCSVEMLREAWAYALRFDARFQVDLIHYSLPYFTEGPDRWLQFRPEDRDAIQAVTDELIKLKEADPERLNQPLMSLRSIPDWLLLGSEMRVPCDSHQMIWVGADGSVQQCYVTFPLGNLHQQRLRDLLFSAAHRQASRDSFLLNCPNCHCHYPARIEKHAPSRARYASPAPTPMR